MQTYDLPQTVELIDAVRETPLLIPTVLAVLCGLRRGEICALRWRNVDLVTGQMSIVESMEQTKAGLRFKSPKSGKGRTVALSATVVDGVHPKVASERLGHSKVGITLDLYSHVIPGMQEDAAAMVDRALSAARDKGRKT